MSAAAESPSTRIPATWEAGPFSLAEFLALPPGEPAELVDGVVRLMPRESRRNRMVQQQLIGALRQTAPGEALVIHQEIVTLMEVPALARIPDVSVVRAVPGDPGTSSSTWARDVLLVVEVTSPSTRSADLREKPVEYALAGIPAFWRIDVESGITVTTHRLADDRYETAGVFGAGGTAVDAALPWAAVEVTPLLGPYA